MKKQLILIVALCALSAWMYADEYDCVVIPTTHGSIIAIQTDDNEFTLTALPDDDWTFEKWNDGSTTNPRVVTLTEDETSFSATFKDNRLANFHLGEIRNPSHGGTVTAVKQGSCNLEWQLTATPEPGTEYAFMGWADGVTENPRIVTIDPSKQHYSYTAIFAQPHYTMETVREDGGLVIVEFDEPNCRYKLSPVPAQEWSFTNWSDGVTDSIRYIPMEKDSSLTAHFAKPTCMALHKVLDNPDYGGSVDAENVDDCYWRWRITATADTGNEYSFLGWSDGYGEATRYVTTNTEGQLHYTYKAIFGRPYCTTETTRDDGGMILVEFDEPNCRQKLSPVPADGWMFTGWSDESLDSVRYLSLDGNHSLTAHFEKHRCVPYRAVITNPVEGGEVTAVKYGSCECDWMLTATADDANEYTFMGWSDGYGERIRYVDINPHNFHYTFTALFETPHLEMDTTQSEGGVIETKWSATGCELTLTAVPADGWIFLNWSDDYPDNPRVIPFEETNIQAVFAQAPCYFYKPTYENSVGGSVSSEHGTCICDYNLTATPNDCYVFANWDDGSGANPRTVNIEATLPNNTPDYEYQATFVTSDAMVEGWTEDKVILSTKDVNLTPTTATIRVNGVEIAADQIPHGEDAGIWSLPAELNAYAGQTLTVIFYDTNGNPVDALSSKVPYVATGTTKFSEIDPALPENTDVEVVSGTMTFDGDAPMVLGALTVYPDAKAVVPTGKAVTFTHIFMRGDGIHHGYPQLVANGSITNLNSDTIYYDYTLDYSSFYPLAVPYDVKCEHIRTKSGKQASYEVQWYDGEERAWNGTGWTVFNDQADGATLRAGTGYIVFAVPYKWHGTRQQTVAVRFPMVANLLAGEQGPKSTTVGAYNFDDVTFPSNKNWNLVGNPYLADYTPSGDNERMMVGYYTPGTSEADVHDYTYTDDAVRYLTYSEDGYMTYRQGRAQDITMRAFNSYFLQSASAGELSFPLSRRAQNAPRRRESRAESEEPRELAFGIVLHSADQSDRTGLLYGETFTPDYELNADLVKMHGSSPTLVLYSLAGTEERAFNALSLDAINQPVPLGFKHATAGLMTFAFDTAHYDASMLEAVMLTDYATGRVVNLLDEHYSFTTAGTEDNARFVINAVLAPRVTTDIGGTGVDGYSTNELDGVYDLLGRRVSLDMLQQGVYIIIENGQSRKEVIQ